MREAERREIFISEREGAELIHDVDELLFDDAERVAHDDELRVAVDEAARRAQVDDALCGGSDVAECRDVRHDVVPLLAFVLFGALVVDVVDVRFELLDLLFRDGKPELHLALRKRDPELPPQAEALLIAEVDEHLAARIAGRQGVFVQ